MYKVYNQLYIYGEEFENFNDAINKIYRLLEDSYKYNAPYNRANSYSITNNTKTVTIKAEEFSVYISFDEKEKLLNDIKEKLGE